MRTEIVEAELRCQSQRLGAGLDRGLVFVREHLVARDLAENQHLDTRRRDVRDDRSRFFEMRDRVIASSLLPSDVRQRECRLSCGLTVPAREQSVAGLRKLLPPLLIPPLHPPPDPEHNARLSAI